MKMIDSNIEDLSVEELQQQQDLTKARIQRLQQEILDLNGLKVSLSREIKKKRGVTRAHNIAN